MSKRAGLWTVVSSAKQLEGSGLDRQIRECEQAIKRRGDNVVIHFKSDVRDSSLSRSIPNLAIAYETHDDYRRLVDAVVSGEIEILYYPEPSRLGRDAILYMEVIRLCQNNGVALFDVSSGNLIKPEDRGMAAQLMAVIGGIAAQDEARKLKEYRRVGMIKNARDHGLFPLADPPYGYKLPDGERPSRDNNIKYETVEEQKEIILLMFEMYMTSMGHRAIANRLNELGYRYKRETTRPHFVRATLNGGKGHTRRSVDAPWRDSNVQRIIGKVWVYAGYVEVFVDSKYDDYQRYKDNSRHEAFISEQLAQRVQDRIDYVAVGKRLGNAKYMLSGLVYCGTCGYACSLERMATPEKSYARCRHGCPHTGNRTVWMMRDAPQMIADELGKYAVHLKGHDRKKDSEKSHRQRIESSIEDNKAKTKRLHEMALNGAIETDGEFYLNSVQELKAELERLTESLKKVPKPLTPQQVEDRISMVDLLAEAVLTNDRRYNAALKATVKLRADPSGLVVEIR